VYTDTATSCGANLSDLGWRIKPVPGAVYGVGFDDGSWLEIGGDAGIPEGMKRWTEVNDAMLRLGLPLFIEADVGKLGGSWLEDVIKLLKNLPTYNPFAPMSSSVSRMVSDPKERLVSTFQTLYVGLVPSPPGKNSVIGRVSPSLFGLLSAMELLTHKGDGRKINGVYQIEGGFGSVASGLEEVLRERGVEVRLNETVGEIREGYEGGVTVDGEGFDAVVCNIDIDTAEGGMVEGGEGGKAMQSGSVLQMHWITGGVKARDSLRCHNVFLADDDVGSWDGLRSQDGGDGGDVDAFNFYLHNPGKGDETACEGGGTSLMALVPLPAGCVLMEEEVEIWKVRVKERVERRTGPLNILYEQYTTPKDWEGRYGLPGGAVFGSSHGLGQLGPTRRGAKMTGVKGGFYVGASKRPGNGVPLVMIGARKTAEEVLKFLKV